MMEELDELRPPTAWRLLEIWRGTRELAEEPPDRAPLRKAAQAVGGISRKP